MTRRDARMARELVRMARLLAMTGMLDKGSVMASALQAAVDELVGDRKVETVDIDVLLAGVDSHGRDYKSREDTAAVKGPSASYRKGDDIMDYLYNEFDTQSFFRDWNRVEEITPTLIRCILKDGSKRNINVVSDPK